MCLSILLSNEFSGRSSAKREQPHQGERDLLHRLIIFDPGRIEALDLAGPDIWREHPAASFGRVIGIGAIDLLPAHLEGFAEVRRGRGVGAVGGSERSLREVATVQLRIGRDVAAFDRLRKIEERARHLLRPLDQVGGHAMTGDHQKADVATCLVDLLRDLQLLRRRSFEVAGNVDDRDGTVGCGRLMRCTRCCHGAAIRGCRGVRLHKKVRQQQPNDAFCRCGCRNMSMHGSDFCRKNGGRCLNFSAGLSATRTSQIRHCLQRQAWRRR